MEPCEECGAGVSGPNWGGTHFTTCSEYREPDTKLEIQSLRSSLKQAQDALAESEKSCEAYVDESIACDNRAKKAEAERDQYKKSIMSWCWPPESDEPGKDELLKEFNAEMEAQESLEQKLIGERDQLAAAVEKYVNVITFELKHTLIQCPCKDPLLEFRMGEERSCTTCRFQKLVSLPTNYKSTLEARDKRVRDDEWDSFVGLISGAVAEGWDITRLLRSAKDARTRADRTIFAMAEKGEKG